MNRWQWTKCVLGMREEMRLPVSLCQKKTLCRVANTLLTAGATDLCTPNAVVMASCVKHTNPEMGRGVVRVAVESRLPKGETTSTAEVTHHITDDTGSATTGDHHVVHTVVLGWSRTSASWPPSLLPSVLPTKALLHHTAGRTRW